MIDFTSHRLENGMTLLHHYDRVTRMVAVNILYKVGSAHEQEPLTGLAHLLEHLMFGGSEHAPSFDQALQRAGGESNAWTSVDATNYYDVLPAPNLDTALWLESDRLIGLTLSNDSIATQKSVVIEEFKQRCLNAPYGDMAHLVGQLAYTVHPYRWPPIGRQVSDIEQATADDVRAFHQAHYAPNNAIICISGNVTRERAIQAVEHWFGDIPARQLPCCDRPIEPEQTQPRMLRVERDVPHTVITRAYHMPHRLSPDFPACDLLSDVLSNGKSARFYQNVIRTTGLFTELDASVGGTLDQGLFYIRGKLTDEATVEAAQQAIDNELQRLFDKGIDGYEVEKFVNKHIATSRFENVGYLQQAMRLCAYEQMGDAAMVNTEEETYRQVTPAHILDTAHRILAPSNCSTLIYQKWRNRDGSLSANC